MNQIQFIWISRARYDALPVKDDNTLYFIYNEHVVYKGTAEYGGVQSITPVQDTDGNYDVTIVNGDGSTTTLHVISNIPQSDWNQTDTTADDYIKNKPTIPVVNNGTLEFVNHNGTVVESFTANQAEGASVSIEPPVDNETIIYNNNGTLGVAAHHIITNREAIIEDEYHHTIYKNTVYCGLDDRQLDVVNLYDLAGDYSHDYKITFNKNAVTNDNMYAGFCRCGSIATQGTFRIKITNVTHNSVQIHNVGYIEDTPSDGVFVFITTLEWNIHLRWNEGTGFWAYLEVPKNFVGDIEIYDFQLTNCDANHSPNCFDDNSSVIWYGMTQDETLNLVSQMSGSVYDDTADPTLRAPYGKYYASIVKNFGRALSIGDYIQDNEINDTILHTLEYRLSTMYSSEGGGGVVAVQSDWDQVDSTAGDYIKNKPTIPNVYDATLTIKQGVATKGTFTANASSNVTINIDAPNNGALTIKNKIPVWRIPTVNEWKYLLQDRSGNKFAKCQVDRQYNCLIVFPDNYTTTLNNINDINVAYTVNALPSSDAELLTQDGCLILPAGGYIRRNSISDVDSVGHYYTSTAGYNNQTYAGFTFSTYLSIGSYPFKYDASSVRLMNDIEGIGPFTISGKAYYFASGNLQYHAVLNEWRFATNQWDYIGNDNTQRSASYDGWIDLFGYGCNGIDNGQVTFMPYDYNNDASKYWSSNLSGTKADWSYVWNENSGSKTYRFTANDSNSTTVELANVAFTGDYNDLNNIPEQEDPYKIFSPTGVFTSLEEPPFMDLGYITGNDLQDDLSCSNLEGMLRIMSTFEGATSEMYDACNRCTELATQYPHVTASEKQDILDELSQLRIVMTDEILKGIRYGDIHISLHKGLGVALANEVDQCDPRGFLLDITNFVNNIGNTLDTAIVDVRDNENPDAFVTAHKDIVTLRTGLDQLIMATEYLINIKANLIAGYENLQNGGTELEYNLNFLPDLVDVLKRMKECLGQMANGTTTYDDRQSIFREVLILADVFEKGRHFLKDDSFYYIGLADNTNVNSISYRLYQLFIDFHNGDLSTETDWASHYNTLDSLITELESYLAIDPSDPTDPAYINIKNTFDSWGGTTISKWNTYNVGLGSDYYDYYVGIDSSKYDDCTLITEYQDYIYNNVASSSFEGTVLQEYQSSTPDPTVFATAWSNLVTALQNDNSSDYILDYEIDMAGYLYDIPLRYCSIVSTFNNMSYHELLFDGCGHTYMFMYNKTINAWDSNNDGINKLYSVLLIQGFNVGLRRELFYRMRPNNLDVNEYARFRDEIIRIHEIIMNVDVQLLNTVGIRYDDYQKLLTDIEFGYDFSNYSYIDMNATMAAIQNYYTYIYGYEHEKAFIKNALNILYRISSLNRSCDEEHFTWGTTNLVPSYEPKDIPSVLTPKGWERAESFMLKHGLGCLDALTWVGTQAEFNLVNWDPNDPMYNLDENKRYREIYITEN